MKRFSKIIAVLLLSLNGISAIFGGWNLMLDPTGRTIQMPLDWLQDSPFNNFFIPGIILFTVNGFFNIFTAVLAIKNTRGYELFILSAGIMLAIWLTVQIIIIKLFYPPLHLTFYLIAFMMIICGIILRKKRTYTDY
jgi:hypothetical protein